MKISEIIVEASKPNNFRDYRGADRKTIAMAKPSLCASGWEIVVPGNFATHWGEAALGQKTDHTWSWCVRGIAALRVEMGMPPKAFPAPVEKNPEGFRATSPKTLLHGTSRTAAAGIAHQGLQPRVGQFVKGAYGNGKHTPLIFAAAVADLQRIVAAMLASVRGITTDSDFFENTALCICPNDGNWFKEKDGYTSPKTVENGDFYRTTPIQPKQILVGDELRDFFKNKVGRLPSDILNLIEPDRSVS